MQQQPDFIKLKVGKSELLCKESANALTDQLLLIRDILVVYSFLTISIFCSMKSCEFLEKDGLILFDCDAFIIAYRVPNLLVDLYHIILLFNSPLIF
jgi:hypothetical protein